MSEGRGLDSQRVGERKRQGKLEKLLIVALSGGQFLLKTLRLILGQGMEVGRTHHGVLEDPWEVMGVAWVQSKPSQSRLIGGVAMCGGS